MAKPADYSYSKSSTPKELKQIIDNMANCILQREKRIEQLEQFNRQKIPLDKTMRRYPKPRTTVNPGLSSTDIKYRVVLGKIEKIVEHIQVSPNTEPQEIMGLVEQVAGLCHVALGSS